jgi:8-oxo-dGTP pyrophosphatase MutT (NUDIX family)/predicted aspartyl protease
MQKQVQWQEPLEEIQFTKQIMKRPIYVLNILYNNHGIFLSKRLQKDKPMFNLWQVAGGKVEKGETSLQAALRETQEETGLEITKEQCQFLFNDPTFNCDVYLTKVSDQQELIRTEPEKQGAWTITEFSQFEFMAKQNELTPTLVEYCTKILNNLHQEEPAYTSQKEKVEEALYGEAIVYGQPVNVLIDSGAVGCIIAKRFLQKVDRDIEGPTNIRIIDVTGQRTAPLGKVFQVPIQIRDIKVYMDMIVTDSSEYNVLLGNEWLKKVNANIDYGQNKITIKHEGIQQQIPITCSQKLDPTKYTVIDPTEELEIEDEEGVDNNLPFYKAEINQTTFQVDRRNYHAGFLEYLHQQSNNSTGMIRRTCFCKNAEEFCEKCNQIQEDWTIYQTLQEEEINNNQYIQLEKDKEVPIGNLEREQCNQLHQLLNENKDLFARTLQELQQTHEGEHVIITEQVPPIKKRAYRTAPRENEFIKAEIDDMLKQGLIQPSTSPWSFPVVIVKKKNGKLRFCVNYKPLNDITKKDNYPLPRIDELLDSLQDAQWFTTLDLASGYWQIKVREEDQEKTAFITKFGTYEFKVMPFGLCNAPATFQRTMDKVLAGIKEQFVLVYLDDVIIYSKTFKEHIQHLTEVLTRIRKANLRLKAEKCYFAATELQFLGHVVGKEGVKPDPEKVDKMVNYPEPKNIRELRGVLGLFSYYRRFIKDFAQLADPLYKLLKKDTVYEWTDLQQQAFENLREKLTQAPVVQYPDFNRPFLLYTDASQIGIGAVLAQKDNDKHEYVIAYASRTLNPAERNYGITELECLAIVWAVKYFRHYLYGSKFTIITDHTALKWLLNSTSENGNRRLERWKIMLSEYDFEIIYRKGKNHANADALSRLNPTSDNNSSPHLTSNLDHG